jgi:hypothetical protein
MTEQRKKGFALLDPEAMRQIAALGGRTAHAAGRAHKFTREEGKAAAARSVAVRKEERERKQRLMAQGITQDAAGTSTSTMGAQAHHAPWPPAGVTADACEKAFKAATVSTPRGSLGEDAA